MMNAPMMKKPAHPGAPADPQMPSAPPQAGPPQQAPAGMPPQGAAPQPTVSGEEVQGLLFSRIEQMSEEELDVLDSIITQETLPVLFKLLPELGILFEKASAFSGGQQAVSGPQGQQDPEISKGDGQESDNPLVNPKVSRGLMGGY